MWLQGGLYAARHLTDGHLPRTVVESLPGDIVRVLIAVGLWLETDSGIQIHDYLDYNPSSVTALQKRERARNRQVSHRNRQPVTPLVTRDKVRDSENVTPLVTRDSRARGTRPHPVQEQVRTHTETSSTSAGERQACVCWHDLWVERWPEGIPQIAPKRIAELERLEQQLGIGELNGRMIQYLADPSDWLIEHKHPVATFITRINSYEAKAPPDRPDRAVSGTARNATPRSEGTTTRVTPATGREQAWEARE